MSSGISYVWRRFADFVGYVNRTAVFEPTTRIDPGPDGITGTADDGGQLEVFRRLNPGVDELVLTNPGDATRRYDAVQVFFRRRFAN